MSITPYFWLAMLACVCVGSFMNVVIHRLPLIINDAWESDTATPSTHYSIAWPGSACPSCNHPLAWYDNIPLLSWLWLRGKCGYCKAPISARYLVVEVLAGLWGSYAWLTSPSLPTFIGVFIVGIILIALAIIDFETLLLPSDLTDPLLWTGILMALNGWGLPTIQDAIYGAVVGYMSLWTLAKTYELATKKEAMGHGDFKLYAALGAVLGVYALPLVMVVACTFTLILALMFRADANRALPFGPGLCFSGILLIISSKSDIFLSSIGAISRMQLF